MVDLGRWQRKAPLTRRSRPAVPLPPHCTWSAWLACTVQHGETTQGPSMEWGHTKKQQLTSCNKISWHFILIILLIKKILKMISTLQCRVSWAPYRRVLPTHSPTSPLPKYQYVVSRAANEQKKDLRDSWHWLIFSGHGNLYMNQNSRMLPKPYTITMFRLKTHRHDMIIILNSFLPALALKVLRKTIKEQVSVQGRIYWHLLLIYGPSLCSLSGLCQSFSSFIFHEEPPMLLLRDRAQVSISFLSGKKRRKREGTRGKAKLRGIY